MLYNATARTLERFPMPSLRLAFTLALAACALACSAPTRGEDPPDPGVDAGSSNCTAGSTVDCTCENNAAGKATCVGDGSRYGVCQCGTSACTAGVPRACNCPDGHQSVEMCRADGSGFDACGCTQVCTPLSKTSCTCGTVPGNKSCLQDGSGYAPCVCQGTCGSSPLAPVGSVQTDYGSLVYTDGSVEAVVGHRRGNDASAGCVAKAKFMVARGDGSCPLTVDYRAVSGAFGGLAAASLSVGSSCSVFPASARGSWATPPGYGPRWFDGAASVPDSTAASSCASGAAIGFGSGTVTFVRASDGATLSLDLGGLTLAGDVTSTGSTALQCVETGCGGAYHDAGGWCVTGGCPSGRHDGGAGSCVANGTCSSGYTLNPSTGACAPTPPCSPGLAASVSAPSGSVAVGTTVVLDGRGSTGSGLGYAWTLQPPSGSSAHLGSTSSSTAGFVPDVSGNYQWALTITDSAGCTDQAQGSTFVSGGSTGTRRKVTVQLTWVGDTVSNGGDLDIHLLGPPPSGVTAFWFDQPVGTALPINLPPPFDVLVGGGGGNGTDVFWGNKTPDWGLNDTTAADGDRANDPSLDVDAQWGLGPETITLNAAFDGQFRVGASYYCARPNNGQYNTASIGTVHATVKVFVDGSLRSTFQSVVALHQRDLWEAAVITVSGGGTAVSVGASSAAVVSLPDVQGLQPTGCTVDKT